MSVYQEHFNSLASKYETVRKKHRNNDPEMLLAQANLEQATLVNAAVILFDKMLWRLLQTTWKSNEPDTINQDLDVVISEFMHTIRIFPSFNDARYIQINTQLAVSHDISQGKFNFISDITDDRELVSTYKIAYAFISQEFPEEDLTMLYAKSGKIAELLVEQ